MAQHYAAVVKLGRVAQLWSYPVKSFAGSPVDTVELTAEGPAGDRAWGVFDDSAEAVLSAKRVGALLEARVEGDTVVLPNGARGVLGAESLDAVLSEWLGRAVRLVHVDDHPTLRVEMHRDNEDERSPLVRWRTPRGRYVDLYPLHLLSTASLDELVRTYTDLDWDVRRFRPNILIDSELHERDWLAHTLRVGDVEINVPDQLTERCVMITRSQPGLLTQRETLRAVAAWNGYEGALTAGSAGALLGCYGEVLKAGTIAVGDEVELLS
jgi:uncharacterized protein YcbX